MQIPANASPFLDPSGRSGLSAPPRAVAFDGGLLPAPGPHKPLPDFRRAAWQPGVVRSQPEPFPASARCIERGCVFPAAAGAGGRCVQHYRQAHEPILFSSHQPTRVVLERAGFGIDSVEEDPSKTEDRRRLRELREAFMDD